MKHKHAQTHDEVSAEPELSYGVMAVGSFKLPEIPEKDSVLFIPLRSVVRLKPPGRLTPR
ncbi:hypothetical protein JMJ77_0007468 [Colletotrichum scovillei]|uniref:Uncharacterized protein n=1 Tax=Colletotrichum scovillei TaxID=1209932 RepID=A0A9P7UFX4_9PEZI|nr:hypothetical protein JMJ77_0007468 [Colletotrichum scovillei]KAG7074471.1 hypothetical protein JMJ76_0010949 [Colletotrichum scovillei]KAG7081388.1 hypothetical protein JMJ78_0003511 [Colletotrichum scovillei]